jgi:hypothetical protein
MVSACDSKNHVGNWARFGICAVCKLRVNIPKATLHDDPNTGSNPGKYATPTERRKQRMADIVGSTHMVSQRPCIERGVKFSPIVRAGRAKYHSRLYL